jgi:hypothetical protein
LVKFVEDRRKGQDPSHGVEESSLGTANSAPFSVRENSLAANEETAVDTGENE